MTMAGTDKLKLTSKLRVGYLKDSRHLVNFRQGNESVQFYVCGMLSNRNL